MTAPLGLAPEPSIGWAIFGAVVVIELVVVIVAFLVTQIGARR